MHPNREFIPLQQLIPLARDGISIVAGGSGCRGGAAQ